jgi:hypothetical protein
VVISGKQIQNLPIKLYLSLKNNSILSLHEFTAVLDGQMFQARGGTPSLSPAGNN